MAENRIRKTDAVQVHGPASAGIWVSKTGTLLKFNPDGTTRTVVTTDQTQTLTNKTFTAPTITNPVIADIDLGASGTAGTVEIFPATASRGKMKFSAADSAGNTTTEVVNASQAGARTYTIPDAGASASFVMTEGAQTVNGVKTFGSAPVMSGASITAGTIPVASFVNGSGLTALASAGLATSASYVKTDAGTKTLLAANATKDRGVLVVVTIDQTFATGDTSQLILKIGETDTIEKGAASATFTDATAGTRFVFGFTNTATKAILATLTAAAGTGTGAATITIIALPNS